MSDSSTRDDKRPSPDALLDAARREERGRLKIFLGAAPGVGKTYEMLQSGRARLTSGADVVVGVVETHGRKETEALVEGFEIIPRRRVDHKGQVLDEMDLDAILARRPELVLVDELAHTNAPESRHPKRYMDVEELLAAGIDVYTTLNIQHVESLNDVVAQITRIRVRETVPDSVLDSADDIEVVDLSPADLIERLQEGKIYLAHTAKRAIEHFFQAGNLTALRELALRRTAQRVDAQLLSHMQSHAIAGPWAAGERVLVCVSEDPRSPALVRYAKRLADRLHAPFVALYIETRRSLQLTEAERDRIAETLRLAEHLGGQSASIPGGDRRIADEVLAYARTENVNHIVIGKTDRSRWFELINGSVVHELVRRAGSISVHVIAGETLPDTATTGRRPATVREPVKPLPYAIALVAVAISLGISKLIQPSVGIENVDLIFLVGIIAVASRFGLGPALVAMVAASLCYNFFFLPPTYTFTIADPTNVAALFIFTLVTFIVSNLAARVRAQAISARGRARTTEQLYSFSRKLAGVGTIDDVLWATAYQIAAMLKVRVVLLLSHDGEFGVRAGYPPEDKLDQADVAAAKWAFENNQPAGRGADTLPGAKWLFLPMRTGRGAIGAIGISSEDKAGPILAPEESRLLDALADQAALAIERVFLVEDIDRAQRSAETDRLRSALLTSISHDLKTPLASIMGAAGTLRDLSAALDEPTKAELIGSIMDESERLNRFIANLLDMTRLESGAVEPNLTLIDVSEVVGTVLRRAAKILARHSVDVRVQPGLPMVRVDPVLFEQALFNLIDNAAKYTPAGSTIRLEAWQRGDRVTLQIIDEGPGLPADDMERIFDKFYRVRKGDNVRAGTGLGLSIARGFVEAMGGMVMASNRNDRSGAVFTVLLPVPDEAAKVGEAA
ncbi:sensor histidine kinase KdpD [Kaistia dalseonensis]|uniref:histidine kinase n=1 Tax=Kaistia dalseonensis TaxID=410840 RepID=A0ABU0H472_9HYPH|nr:sensor histidine kinase KdpD [Kaistia dalseonensis]MCX5494529.1 sensor histidine kinase KdpD [Kaistia dalseonensis]MDQ0437108.1 two-component system sensor histidine kinase KdpD [Kaistia dalseonensis]